MTANGAVAIRDGNPGTTALAIRPGQEMFSDKQRAALAVLGIKDATNADLAVYMHYCQKTGLDPFSRQIYMICRREKQGNDWVAKQTIQVGIDGFRVIRDRIAARLGISVEYEDTLWFDADGEPYSVWLSQEAPAACKVTVVRDGHRFPGVVRTAAYMARNKEGAPAGQWKTQPDHMIEKCAEAFALRRAFPNDLGGLYLEDEMPPMPAEVRQQRPQRVTRAEIIGEQVPAAEDDTQPRKSLAASAGRNPGLPGATAPRGAQPPSPQDQPQRAGKAAQAKLDGLLAALPLGPPEDVSTLLEWVCGGPYTASRSHCQLVTSLLEDFLATAQGDVEAAAEAIWAQYRAATAQDAAEASQDEAPGEVTP